MQCNTINTYIHTNIHTNIHTYIHTNIPTYHHHRPQGGGPEEPYHHHRPQGAGTRRTIPPSQATGGGDHGWGRGGLGSPGSYIHMYRDTVFSIYSKQQNLREKLQFATEKMVWNSGFSLVWPCYSKLDLLSTLVSAAWQLAAYGSRMDHPGFPMSREPAWSVA